MSENTLIGRSMKRKDAYAKATGRYIYGMDHRVEGALESLIVRSPHPHARIEGIDTSKAEALPGVHAVMTGQELADIRLLGEVCDKPVLAIDVVRYWGEPVALVAAETLELAEQAAELIEIDYRPLAVINDPEDALRADAPLLHPEWEAYECGDELYRSGNIACHASVQKGNVEEGFAQADFIFENDFSTSSVHQSSIEQRASTAIWQADGSVRVYTNTQLLFHVRNGVAHVMDLPEEKVIMVSTGVGGAFGSKLYGQIEPLVALLARKTGRAVHMATTLEDELSDSLPRHPVKFHLKTGLKKDGSIVAHQATAIVDIGAYASAGTELAGIEALLLAGLYRIPNVQVDGYSVYTNKMNFGAYRGPGGPQATFALESHIDDVARKMGLDPLAFRLDNILREGEEYANGQVLQAVGLREALEKASAAIEWDKPAGKNCGKGLAISWWTTTLRKSTAKAGLGQDGNVVVSIGTQDLGTGSLMGSLPQIVADTMGVQMDDVTIQIPDTSEGLWDWGTQGSRALFNVGRASHGACQGLKEKMIQLSSRILEEEPDELAVGDKAVFLKKDPSVRISFSQLYLVDKKKELEFIFESELPETPFKPEQVKALMFPSFNYPSFHCHAAEVEVDPDTGQVKILRYAAAHDIGHAINPDLIKGQIRGGAVQGIGMALMEDVHYEKGVRTNINWTDYKLPTIGDVPDIDAIIVECPNYVDNPYGVKGLGESPVIHAPAALANAITQAAGARVHSLPMTAEKIYFAMHPDKDA